MNVLASVLVCFWSVPYDPTQGDRRCSTTMTAFVIQMKAVAVVAALSRADRAGSRL